MPKTLYLIDGHAQLYRAYYAPFRVLSSPTGEPTKATFIFCQMLLNLIRDRRPDYLVMVLDADETKLLRRQIYPEYKAHREPPPEDMPPQEERVVSILQAAGVPILRLEGFEADDIIATLARRHASPDLQVYIVSRDKDLEQLINDHVVLFDPMKNEETDAARLLETKGWPPEQAVEAQILTGDSVDNVPGVQGIGDKTAAKLLQKYGSAAGVVEHADELTPKQRDNVRAFAANMEMVRQLVTLRDDVPLELDLARAACGRFTWSRIRPAFESLGFRRLLELLPASGDAAATDLFEAARGDDSTKPPASAAPPAVTAGRDYRLVNTMDGLDQLAAALASQPEFAVDTETTSTSPMDCELVGLSFAWEEGRAYYVPVRAAIGEVLPMDAVRQRLGPLLANEQKRKVGQNLKYDLNVLRNAGMPLAGPLFDTMIAAFVLDPTRGSYGIDSLSQFFFHHRKIATSELLGTGRDVITMDQVPLPHVAEYAGEDADYTWRLQHLLEPRLAPAGVDRLFYDVEMPLVGVLTDMEAAGITLDTDLLASIGRELAARVEAITEQVHRIVGHPFNLDSPKQLATVLFDERKCRVVRRTKTTRSTDADTLEVLARETSDPLFALLLEYREIQKLRGTYVDALPTCRSRRTGRVHTSFHQTGTVTGRLSSSDPNLQNIPVRTEAGRQIRRAFVPRSPDEVLIVADYSQVELRVLAHFCKDEAMIRAFVEDQDIHAFVAGELAGVPVSEVTKEQRSRAKTVNFGIVFGQTAFGLAQGTGMSRTEAQAFIDAYFQRYPRIHEFIDRCAGDARREGSVRTILGRRRAIDGILSDNQTIRAQAERLAVNTVIQGSAADLIKIAMIRLSERIRLERLPLRMLLQVHDELVCEGPRAGAAELAGVIREEMAAAMSLRVPLKVDVAWGANWLEAK